MNGLLIGIISVSLFVPVILLFHSLYRKDYETPSAKAIFLNQLNIFFIT